MNNVANIVIMIASEQLRKQPHLKLEELDTLFTINK